ncbi:MAG: MCE family protein [Gemmatimonadetes bacterium]|nr:MCE family protein [Gemmatimonadota bacterium]
MKRSNEVLVGLVVIVGVMVVVFGTIWLKGVKPGRERTDLVARFDRVGQLLEGGVVKLRGVPIGRVEKIALDSTGDGVLVTMSIRSDVQLPPEAVVVLSPESLFGDWQAEIGGKADPDFESYDYAQPVGAGVLPGYSLPELSRITAVADQIAHDLAILSDRFQEAFTTETAKNIRLAIENIQQVSEQLTGLVGKQQSAFDSVAADLTRTSQAAGQAAETLDRAFTEVEAAIGGGKLTGIVDNVQRSSVRVDSLTTELMAASRALRRMALGADTTLRRMGTIATSLERGEGSLGMLLRDTALYYSLAEGSVQLQALLKDIREHPRKYINLTVF